MFKGQIRSLLLLPILIGGVCFPVSAEDYPAYQLTHMVEGAGHASWSPDGTMIAFESMGSNHDIWVIPAKGGEPTQITTHAANDKQPDWSPDGQSLVYESERSGAQGDIWRYDFQTQTHTQLTTYSWIDWSPKWSPDGTTIAYASTRNNISLDIWTLSLIDGSYTQITTNPGTEWGPAWSPDGSHILFVGDAAGNNDLYTVPVDRSEAPFQVTAHAGWDALGSWSPDGTEIVFGSDRDGNFDIWTVPVSGGDATQIIDWPSFEGNPDWSPDGSRIAFESDRGGSVQDIWIVTVAPFTRVTEGPLVNDGGNSAGVCMIDYDGDNLLDIYVVNTSLTGTKNSLFRNIGNASFEKVTGLPIVEDIAMGYGASWADFEGDDDLDVAVANFRYQASVLYLNDGQGGFAATTNGPLSAGAAGSTSASWIDNDLDNDLDLFIANSTGPISADYPPYVNFLFRNDNGTLTRITSDVIATVSRHTYGASWSDYDNDGDPDLVNSNNVGEPSDLFLNGGDGGFALAPPTLLGPEGAGVGGCSWADYDNDGDLDLYIASSSPGPSLLYRNDGGGSLSKVSDHGLGILNGRATAGVWADYDNDGDQDIFVWFNDFQVMSNSHGYLFENLGDGTFGRLSADLFECDSCSAWSAVWGDVDRDGDLDLLVARMDPQWQGRPEYMNELLYLNNGNNNHWITVKPVGTTSNRSAVGVKIRIKATISGQPIWQLQELQTQTGLRSQGPLELHFGLGDAMVIDSLKLEWPSGIVQMRENVTVDQYLTIYESCCEGRVGNANDFGTYPQEVTISDIQSLVTAKFIVGRCDGLVSCIAEGDANQSGGTSPACKDITISDIQMLVNHLFIAGPANAPLNDCL